MYIYLLSYSIVCKFACKSAKLWVQVIKTKPICLICNESVSVLKEYNIKRHYETKHANKFDKYKGQFRQDQVNDLKRKMSAQQKIFTRAGSIN